MPEPYNYDYITIDGVAFPRPVEFAPQREDVYVAEIITMDQTWLADVVGWKFSDMDLKWRALPESLVAALTNLSGEFVATFDDPNGIHNETAVRTNAVSTKKRQTIDGVSYWLDVSVTLKFVCTHPYEEVL